MKNIKPVYVVDITSCKNVNDVIYMFAYEKVNAGLPITMLEYKTSIKSYTDNYKTLEDIVNECFDEAVNTVSAITDKLCNTNTKTNDTVEKKPNVFKRFWNWLTNKK